MVMAAAKKKPTAKTVTMKPTKKGQKPIKFKADGSLTKAAGKTKSGKLNQAKVAKLAKSGTPDQKKKALFYKNILKKK